MTEKGGIALGVAVIGVAAVALVLAKRASPGMVTVDLVAGNNEIVFQGSTRDIAPAFDGYEDCVNAVWWWDDETQTWYSYGPGAPSDLWYLVEGETYVIHANEDCQWAYTL